MTLSNAGVRLFDAVGNELLVADGVAIPADTPRILIAGVDGLGNASTPTLDSSGRLLTSTIAIPPPGTDPVSVIVQGAIGGFLIVDTDYVIPDAKTLTITKFFAGGEVNARESKFELFHSTDAGVTDGTLLDFGYIGDGDQNIDRELDISILGSGVTQVIRLRRERFDANTRELAAGWRGSQTV